MQTRERVVNRWRSVIAAAGAALISGSSGAWAYSIEWYTIDHGGGQSAGGAGYVLAGAAGQPDVGSHAGGPWELRGGFFFGTRAPAGIDGNAAIDPIVVTRLYSPRPSPATSDARATFQLARPGHARLSIYDARGALAATLFDHSTGAGLHEVPILSASDRPHGLASGVYFMTLDHDGHRLTRKFVFTRR